MNQFPLAPLIDSNLQRDAPLQLKQRAQQQGYLFCPGLIEQQKIAALSAKVLQICADLDFLAQPFNTRQPLAAPHSSGLAYDDKRYIELQQRCLVLPESVQLRECHEITRALRLVSEQTLNSGYGDVLRISFPNSIALTTEPHQEQHYVHCDQALWIVWIPLHDCPLNLGPLAVAAGSQQLGLLPHQPVSNALEAAGRYTVELPATRLWSSAAMHRGDAVFFHGLTVHRACPNLSHNQVRLSIDFRYGA